MSSPTRRVDAKATPTTMHAIVVEDFGAPDVLRVRDWPVPEVVPGRVLIRVHCAGVNFSEVMSRRGGYLGVELPFVPGMEVSGTVVEIGEGVDHLAPGDRVCALTLSGGYAELALADARLVFPVPDGVDWPLAAALPTIVPTAHALLHELGGVRPGDRVLITAAAGATGMVLSQMARAAGARAVGVTSSPEKAAAARGSGFEEVLTVADVEAGALEAESLQLVLDSVGGDARAAGWTALAPFGLLIAYGNASGTPEQPLTPATLRTNNQRAGGLSISALAAAHPELLADIAERSFALVADVTIEVPISAIRPLSAAAEAHRDLENRRTVGKTILAVATGETLQHSTPGSSPTRS